MQKPSWLSSTSAKLRTSRGSCLHLGFRIGLDFVLGPYPGSSLLELRREPIPWRTFGQPAA